MSTESDTPFATLGHTMVETDLAAISSFKPGKAVALGCKGKMAEGRLTRARMVTRRY